MPFSLSEEEQKNLLIQARESVTAKLEGRPPEYQFIAGDNSSLKTPCGAFVSLHIDDGFGKHSLRGCIGRMTANLPLEETVRIMAREAAFGDPRFPPLKKEELPRCQIEISALSPMSRCPDPRQVKVGVHGLYLIRGSRSGVLLPQVPVEQGWDLDQYLEYICIKAGLPPGSYNAPDAELYTFTAIVFGEE
ncbi:MAG: AmmeMemoRadiSam system protein A [Treponema sp.]|nr:AmmeMemoRadiSam system protein A [Treponema sp.]